MIDKSGKNLFSTRQTSFYQRFLYAILQKEVMMIGSQLHPAGLIDEV